MLFWKKLFRRPFPQKRLGNKKKIKIAIEIDTFDKGGLQKVVLDSALRLNPERFDVIIISVNGGGYWASAAEKHGIKVYTLDGVRHTKKYREILVEHDIDLSCSHFSRVGYPVSRSLGIPNITFIHNVYAFMPEQMVRNFQKDDQFVDLYISVSKKATRYAIKRLGVDPEKVVTVPNGLIIEEHRKREEISPEIDRAQFGIRPGDYIFLNVASYNLHKGHYLMAEAMKRLKGKRNDIKLLCIGNEIFPPHVEGLRAYLRESKLEDYMLMPGYFPHVESFYRMADAFLLPSFIEGWSIAMNEAMYYGKPMILTDTGGSAEVIEGNDIGILISNEYGDITNLHCGLLDRLAYECREYSITDELVAAMIDFADNRERWQHAGLKGREKLISHYNFDEVILQYERIFIDILSSSK